MHQRIKTIQISDQAFKQKQETNKSRKVLLEFVDKFGKHMNRQNLWIHKMKRLKLINMNRTIL